MHCSWWRSRAPSGRKSGVQEKDSAPSPLFPVPHSPLAGCPFPTSPPHLIACSFRYRRLQLLRGQALLDPDLAILRYIAVHDCREVNAVDLLEHTSSLTASLPSPPAPWAYLDRCRCGPFTASGLQSAHPLSPLPTPAPPGRTLTGAGVVPSLHPVASASQISMMTRLLLTKGVMRGFWKKDDSLRVGWSAGGRGRFVRGAGERVGVGEGRVPGTLDRPALRSTPRPACSPLARTPPPLLT